MSKEKQIEKMAIDIQYARGSVEHWHCRDENCNECKYKHCTNSAVAESLFEKGYRKQSEGEWVWINQAEGYLEPPYGDTCKCSLCGFVIDVSEAHFRFCPNCGAKMKGD